jgi:hypothetical protein
MTNERLIGELQSMGIDNESYRVIALLPLVQVAWADGTVQSSERDLILQTASSRQLLAGDGAAILESWLTHPPSETYLARGQTLLVELACQPAGVGEAFSLQTLDDILELCEGVARAAGGLFGLAWTVDERERTALREIAAQLDVAMVDTSASWDALSDELR